MKTVRHFTMALALLAMVACTTLVPKTFNERLAAGYVTVTSVRQTTTTLLQGGKISSTDAQNVQKQADSVREGLDVARQLKLALPQAGEDKLTATLAVLTSLQTYLEARQKGSK